MVATGCADKPKHQDGTAAPAGSPSASTENTPIESTPPTESETSKAPTGTATNAGTNAPVKCQTNQLTGDIEQYEPPGQAGSTNKGGDRSGRDPARWRRFDPDLRGVRGDLRAR
jgi:hypothetical protein